MELQEGRESFGLRAGLMAFFVVSSNRLLVAIYRLPSNPNRSAGFPPSTVGTQGILFGY